MVLLQDKSVLDQFLDPRVERTLQVRPPASYKWVPEDCELLDFSPHRMCGILAGRFVETEGKSPFLYHSTTLEGYAFVTERRSPGRSENGSIETFRRCCES